MAHQDQGRSRAGSHAVQLYKALRWLLKEACFDGIAFRRDCTWTPRALIYGGLLWVWSDEKTLTDRFSIARKIITLQFGRQHEPAGSYQAFMKLLARWTDSLLAILQGAFRRQMATALAGVWTMAGYVVFAVDGSRVDVPRTRSNERRYSPGSKLSKKQQRRRTRRRRARQRRDREARQRKANIPQIWLTTLWHVGSGLPWNWRTGPSDSSERDHLKQMLASLPERSLITADAGFVGYDLWTTLQGAGCELVVRVGGNTRLLKKLGYAREAGHTVYLWPNRAASKRQPPLKLRLVIATGGRHPVCLVTSVLDQKRLSDARVVDIYARRWGIELFYRHCKQTFERRKLRSHNADHATIELHWSLLGVWAMGLHSHHRLIQQGVPPDRISFAGALRAYRRAMRHFPCRPDPGERLDQMLDRAIIDDYVRTNKTSRDYPRKKHEPPPRPPNIDNATKMQITQAQSLNATKKIRLTA